MDEFSQYRNFEWDEGNSEKNWIRHQVTQVECEQVFLNQPLIIADDIRHSQQENRYYALGQTDESRRLFVVFTLRGQWVRVISSRDMNRRERRIHENAE